MSHFATYTCNVSNVDFIKAGLKDMGLGYKENTQIKDYYGQTRQATLAVVGKNGKLLPLGWVRSKGKLELQADWYKVPMAERDFTNTIAQHHAKYQVLEACEENRWEVEMEDITFNDNGELEIHATQFS